MDMKIVLNSNVGLIIAIAGFILVVALLFFVGGGDKSDSSGGRVVTTMGSPSPAGNGGDNEESWLVAHNTIREKAWGNSDNDLEWSPELAAQAKEYAESMAGSGIFVHSNTTNTQICDPGKSYKCGENLSEDRGNSVVVTPMETVQRWYDECEDYPGSDASVESIATSSGHYTQVVWKNAKQVGCAYATNNLGEQYGVCLYDTGNITVNGIGFNDNVPAMGSCNAQS